MADDQAASAATRRLPDLRLIGLAAAGWATTGWALTAAAADARLPWALAAVATVGGAIATWRRWWWWLALSIIVACLLGTTLVRTAQVHDGRTAGLARERAAVTVTGTLVGDVRRLAGGATRAETSVVVISVHTITARGRKHRGGPDLVVRASGDLGHALERQPSGATVTLTGVLRPAEPADPQAGVLNLRAPPAQTAGPGWGGRVINRLRAGLAHSTRLSSPHQAGLLPSLVVGDTSRLPPDVVEQFKATGLTHLTAVSGSNLVLVIGFVSLVLTRVGVLGWWLRAVQVAAVFGFVVLCRVEPSVVRAAAMGLVALAALGRAGVGRHRDLQRGLRHLSVAVLVLMIVDPWLSRSWGFALSAGATAGLVACAGTFQRALTWAPRWLAEAIAVPLAAQLATQPLVTALSGTVSISGLVANALAGPFVGPATVVGMLAALTSALPAPAGPALSVGFGWLGGWTVEPLLQIARLGAAVPGGTLTWPSSAVGLIVIGSLSVAAALATPLVLRSRIAVITLALVLGIALARAPAVPGFPGPWRIAFCSVGQGDAAVLRAADHQAVLVDTGPDPKPLVGCLRQLGVRSLPVVVISHFHADHQGGLAAVLDTFPVGRIVVSRDASLPGATEVSALAARHGVPLVTAQAGEAWQVGEVGWRTIRAGPPPGTAAATASSALDPESSAENDASVMGVASVGGLRVLLAGDSEPPAQRAALRTGADLSADIIAMPHHGSSRQERRFWQAAGASVAVSSSGVDNDYGHPAGKALDLAESLGMAVARTDVSGSLAIHRGQRGLVIVTNQAPQK